MTNDKFPMTNQILDPNVKKELFLILSFVIDSSFVIRILSF